MMPQRPKIVLRNADVRASLQQAWTDSDPGLTGGHEEGGFIVNDTDGNLKVIRWSKGSKDTIQVPPHKDCVMDDIEIIASFHTHPNTGSDYLQEPSETDKRAVRDNPNLMGSEYIGEFVISQDVIYLISPAGQVREIEDTQVVFTQ